MKITLLGTGTSTGVPAIGCKCAVCTSDDPKNKRLRPSVLVETGEASILIDTSPDFRQQALTHDIKRVHAVLYTHTHADHLHGIDDLRSYNFIQWAPVPAYGNADTIEYIRNMFGYIFDGQHSEGGGKPVIKTHVVDAPFEVEGVTVEPLPVFHGSQLILAYKIGPFAYMPDVSKIPPETMDKLRGVELMVLDALRYKPHPTHMCLDQAIEAAGAIGAKRTVLTHFSHVIEHGEISKKLPQGIEPAYDGMEIIVDE